MAGRSVTGLGQPAVLVQGVEKYAPWVRERSILLPGDMYQEWLNVDHQKLHIVKHEDFIPKEFRPTFNSHTIEVEFSQDRGTVGAFSVF